MLENSLHASVDVISREIRFMSVNPGFVEFDGSFQVMLFHIPKLISGVDISAKSAEVVYGFDPKKPEESYRAVMDLWTLDGDYCIFRWTIPFTFFAEKRWAFFQVRIRTTSGTTVESQWSTKLKKVYVTPGFTGGQEAYTQAQQDAIAALNSRVTALEASEGGSGSIQLQVDQTPTENSQNLVTSGGVYKAIQEIEPSGSSEDSRIPTPTVSDNGKVLGVVNGVYALKTDETGSGGSGEDSRIPTPTASDNGKVLGVVDGAYALKTDETGSGGSSITVDDALSATSENPVQNKVIYQALQNSGGGPGTWQDVTSSADIKLLDLYNTIFDSSSVHLYTPTVLYNAALGLAFVAFRVYAEVDSVNFEQYHNTIDIGQVAYGPTLTSYPDMNNRPVSCYVERGYQSYIEAYGSAELVHYTSSDYSPNNYRWEIKLVPESSGGKYNIYVSTMYPCDGA